MVFDDMFAFLLRKWTKCYENEKKNPKQNRTIIFVTTCKASHWNGTKKLNS